MQLMCFASDVIDSVEVNDIPTHVTQLSTNSINNDCDRQAENETVLCFTDFSTEDQHDVDAGREMSSTSETNTKSTDEISSLKEPSTTQMEQSELKELLNDRQHREDGDLMSEDSCTVTDKSTEHESVCIEGASSEPNSSHVHLSTVNDVSNTDITADLPMVSTAGS